MDELFAPYRLLTDAASMREHPLAEPTSWAAWSVAPDGTIYAGAVVVTLDAPSYAPAGPTDLDIEDLVDVVPSGMAVPVQDATYWIPADESAGSR